VRQKLESDGHRVHRHVSGLAPFGLLTATNIPTITFLRRPGLQYSLVYGPQAPSCRARPQRWLQTSNNIEHGHGTFKLTSKPATNRPSLADLPVSGLRLQPRGMSSPKGLGCPKRVTSHQQPTGSDPQAHVRPSASGKALAGCGTQRPQPAVRPKRGHGVNPDSHAASPNSVAIYGVPPAVSRWLTYEILIQPLPVGSVFCSPYRLETVRHLGTFILVYCRSGRRTEGTEQVVLADGP
jgi:hypothetical protein